jgi:translation initiation factor 1
MGKRKNPDSRLVYSTDGGRRCPQCQRPVGECVCGDSRPAAIGDGIVRLHRETRGRGGKAVTVIKGLPLASDGLQALASRLKKTCGVGGAAKEGNIEIQGDRRDMLKVELEKIGYRVKISGG